MKIQIILIGKNKDQWVNAAMDDFLRKLKPYTEINIQVLKEEKITKAQDVNQIKKMEGERILATVQKDFALIVLDEQGKHLKSKALADLIEAKIDLGQNIAFVIGGALGLSPEVKQKADLILSFSCLTFTHQMIRIFLLEQIYRAFNILKGTEYHKE